MERTSEKTNLDDEQKDDSLTAKVEKGIYKAFGSSDPGKKTPIVKIEPKFKNPIQAVAQTITNTNVTVSKGAKRFWEMTTEVFNDEGKS